MSLSRLFGLKSFIVFSFIGFITAIFIIIQKNNECQTNVALHDINVAAAAAAAAADDDKVVGDVPPLLPPRSNHVSFCTSGVPCEYLDKVDLRIIVLTFNRWQSLERLLSSLNDLELDGDLASVEIWIDRSKDTNEVDKATLGGATNFRWRHDRGQVRVHVQQTHVGICGQWIDTWKPSHEDDDDPSTTVLILEDDISLSPFAYRWLKAAHQFYASDERIVGITLQSEGLIVARSGGPFTPLASNGPAFSYALVGSWGFSPRPRQWSQFQQWYHDVRTNDVTYRPFVKGIVMSNWYKMFVKKGKEETMWTMWFIAFCHDHHLFTLYNNLNSLENKTANCLAVNRREPGLHFHKKPINNTGLLLRHWKDKYVDFSSNTNRYGFDAKRI